MAKSFQSFVFLFVFLFASISCFSQTLNLVDQFKTDENIKYLIKNSDKHDDFENVSIGIKFLCRPNKDKSNILTLTYKISMNEDNLGVAFHFNILVPLDQKYMNSFIYNNDEPKAIIMYKNKNEEYERLNTTYLTDYCDISDINSTDDPSLSKLMYNINFVKYKNLFNFIKKMYDENISNFSIRIYMNSKNDQIPYEDYNFILDLSSKIIIDKATSLLKYIND